MYLLYLPSETEYKVSVVSFGIAMPYPPFLLFEKNIHSNTGEIKLSIKRQGFELL